MHRHQHRAHAGAGSNGDDGPVVQGDRHGGQGRVAQGGGVGDARAALGHGCVGRQMQRGVGWQQDLLRGAGRASGRETVVVGQRLHTLGDAQQLHKGAAAISTATSARARRRGVQGLIQVGAAFQRLDDGVSGGRGGHGAVLRCRTAV